MARKRPAAMPTDEAEDPLVVWERFMGPRREIDEDASGLIAEFVGRIARKELPEGLELASRAARRIRMIPLPATRAAEVARESLGHAIWIADTFLEGAGDDRGRLALAERNAAAKLHAEEWHLYRSDGVRDPSLMAGRAASDGIWHATLEVARVAARLLECIRQVIEDTPEDFAARAASSIAHGIEAAELSLGREELDRMDGAARWDLKPPRHPAAAPRPLWPANPPAWYDADEERRALIRIGTYVKKHMMTKQEPSKHTPEDVLKGVTFPAREVGTLERLEIAEERFAEVQRIQFQGIQWLLDSLRGETLGSFEKNRALASRVMRMVNDSGGVLLMSGEFIDARGRTKVYTNKPVVIRCERQDSPSFHLRTPDGYAYITALPTWPGLYVVNKDSLGKPPLRS